MARKKATLDAFKPFFAVVDDRGREYERTADFAEGLDMVRSTAAQRGGAALVDGNALPQTRPNDGTEGRAGADVAKAMQLSRLPPVSGAWSTMPLARAQKVLRASAAELYGRVLAATEGGVHRDRKGGIGETLSSKLFSPGDKLGILRENAKTGKVLPGVDTAYASRGVSFLPHWSAFKEPFDISVTKEDGNFCVGSVPECRQTCLVFTGQRKMESGAYAASWIYSQLLRQHPEELLCLIKHSCLAWARKSPEQLGGDDVRLFFRLNVFSDIPWEAYAPGFIEELSDTIRSSKRLSAEPESGWSFYDYTKLRGRPGIEGYYDLTFSFTGYPGNTQELVRILNDERGVAKRCAVVFLKDEGGTYKREPGKALKTEDYYYPFTFFDYPVWNGDKSDIRPLDPEDVKVVGLLYKPSKYKVLSPDGKSFSQKSFVEPEELDTKMRMFLVRVVQPDPEAPPVVCAVQDTTNRTYLPVLD